MVNNETSFLSVFSWGEETCGSQKPSECCCATVFCCLLDADLKLMAGIAEVSVYGVIPICFNVCVSFDYLVYGLKKLYLSYTNKVKRNLGRKT